MRTWLQEVMQRSFKELLDLMDQEEGLLTNQVPVTACSLSLKQVRLNICWHVARMMVILGLGRIFRVFPDKHSERACLRSCYQMCDGLMQFEGYNGARGLKFTFFRAMSLYRKMVGTEDLDIKIL